VRLARMSGDRDPTRFDSAWAVGLAAVFLLALVAWRSTLGMSLFDDGFYAAATLRLAQGARLFVDEMFVQSTGFLVAVPFARAWTALFGTAGFVVALRLFYVALAGAVALVVYRAFRPSFGRWAAFGGAAVPLLAPPFNLLAVSYNTMAALGLILALALSFRALRDTDRRAAAAAGAAAAFASISYPPLAFVAVAMLCSLAFLGRDRRLTTAMVAGACGAVVVFGVWLFAVEGVSIADLRLTYDYVMRAYSSAGSGVRMSYQVGRLWELLTRHWAPALLAWFVPVVSISLGVAFAAVRFPEREELRGRMAFLIPVALAIPVLVNVLGPGRDGGLWTVGGNYLAALVLFSLPGLVVSARGGSSDMRRLLILALPAGAIGFVIVSATTSASVYWASGVVGLAPLGAAAVVWLVSEVRRSSHPRLDLYATLMLTLSFAMLLFGASFRDGPPLALRHTIVAGPYAGVTTTDASAAVLSGFDRLAARWVGPTTGVLVLSAPGPYVVLGGVMVTNAVWPYLGPADTATIDYFERVGRWPDVVFLPSWMLSDSGAPIGSSKADPLLVGIAARYRVVERSAATGFTVLTGAPEGPP